MNKHLNGPATCVAMVLFALSLSSCAPKDVFLQNPRRKSKDFFANEAGPVTPNSFEMLHFVIQRLVMTNKSVGRLITQKLTQDPCQEVNGDTITWNACAAKRKDKQLTTSGRETVTKSDDSLQWQLRSDPLVTKISDQKPPTSDKFAYQSEFSETRQLTVVAAGKQILDVEETLEIPYHITKGSAVEDSQLSVRIRGEWHIDPVTMAVQSIRRLSLELSVREAQLTPRYVKSIYLLADQLDVLSPCGWPQGQLQGLVHEAGHAAGATTVDVSGSGLQDSLTGKLARGMPHAPLCTTDLIPDYTYFARL